MPWVVYFKEGEMMSKRYNVWITDEDGRRSLLTYRNRTAWTVRTAIKHAEDFVNVFGYRCSVVLEVE